MTHAYDERGCSQVAAGSDGELCCHRDHSNFHTEKCTGAITVAAVVLYVKPHSLSFSLLFPFLTSLFCSVFGVFSAQRINSIAQENYKSFAGQAYFDQGGFFVSVMWSAPLLVLATCILVNLLLQTCAMMAQVKAQQFRREAARRARAAEAKK